MQHASQYCMLTKICLAMQRCSMPGHAEMQHAWPCRDAACLARDTMCQLQHQQRSAWLCREAACLARDYPHYAWSWLAVQISIQHGLCCNIHPSIRVAYVPLGSDSAAYTPTPLRDTEEEEKYSISGMFLNACRTSSMQEESDAFQSRSRLGYDNYSVAS
jgi:hypothetical protein